MTSTPRKSLENAEAIFNQPLMHLLYEAQTAHRANFDPNEIQISTLVSIKTGSCPENCSYCPQSAHYNTGLKTEPLMDKEKVFEAAKNKGGRRHKIVFRSRMAWTA